MMRTSLWAHPAIQSEIADIQSVPTIAGLVVAIRLSSSCYGDEHDGGDGSKDPVRKPVRSSTVLERGNRLEPVRSTAELDGSAGLVRNSRVLERGNKLEPVRRSAGSNEHDGRIGLVHR